MRFSTALVASLATYVSAVDIGTKTEAKQSSFTPIDWGAMPNSEDLSVNTPFTIETGAAAPDLNASNAAVATPSADTAQSTDTTAATDAEPKADASTGAEKKDGTAEQPMITADTKIKQPLIVNEQEEAPESQNANIGGKGHHHKAPYDGYFENPNHQDYDYKLPGPAELPSPDFNKQVYEFDEMRQIWHQSNYNERVKVEAEIMVSLEALKTQVRYMGEDLVNIKDFLSAQYLGIKAEELFQSSHDV